MQQPEPSGELARLSIRPDDGRRNKSERSFDDLPPEVLTKILELCGVADVLACGSASPAAHSVAADQYFWKKKCQLLLSEYGMRVDDYRVWFNQPLDFREVCLRLERICGGELLPACHRCRRSTCLQGCVEDEHRKYGLDLGGKLSWLVTPAMELKRHQTMLSLPKVIKCADCDSIIPSVFFGASSPCKCTIGKEYSFEQFCSQASLSGRTDRFEYCSQQLDGHLETCCLYCKHRIYTENSTGLECHLMRECYEENDIGSKDASEEILAICNGFCLDSAHQMKMRSMDFVSPHMALQQGGPSLAVAKAFLRHILSAELEELRRPHGVLVFCHALSLSPEVRKAMLGFFFLDLKLSRVCMVPKPLAVSAERGLETCVVVDSGATHTVVAVVVDGKIITERCRELPVGGRQIAESLHMAHACDDASQEISVSSLDSAEVKEQCRLSYNLALEEQSECTVRCESIWVPAPNRKNMRMKSWKLISLGNETFRAPEYMYVQLDLPQVIVDVTSGLPQDQLKDCLSHIALTGGNTSLNGFDSRLKRDLCELLPEYAAIIDIARGLGSRSSDAAVGSTFIPFPLKHEPVPQQSEAGSASWISRDEFLFFGAELLC